MPGRQQESQQPPQPVAYDIDGRPLYHHPPVAAHQPQPSAQQPYQPTSLVTNKPTMQEGHNFNPQIRAQYANEPDIVHTTRPYEPTVALMSDKLRAKHEESKRLYPFLNLSEGEFVMLRIRRHPIGLFIPVGITVLLVALFVAIILMYPDMYASSSAGLPGVASVVGLLSIMSLVVLGGGGVAVWVYLQNQFFLTNESVIQEIQHGLFSRHEQTVSLGSIEDASFKQYGVLPHIFGYGIMRLSTEGEETTYRFNYVENPKQQVAIVNNAVEAFKNGRPVGDAYLDD